MTKNRMKNSQHKFFLEKIALPDVHPVPTLTTKSEQGYLYWLVTEQFSRQGSIVEIGTWFGGSAQYLAAGLRDCNAQEKLYCFDRFVLTDAEKKRLRSEYGDELRDVDMRAYVEARLTSLYPGTVVVRSYIDQIQWRAGAVEIMHLDAPKRTRDILHVLSTFQTTLIPDVSLVVVQDFCVPRAYALPLIFEALHDSFEMVYQQPEGTTVTFLYRRPYVVNERLNVSLWNVERAVHVHERMTKKFDGEHQRLLSIGLARYCLDHGDVDHATSILDHVSL